MDPAMRSYLIDTGKQTMEAMHADGDDQFMPTLVTECDGKYEVMLMIGAHPFTMMSAILPQLRELKPDTLGLTIDSYMASGDVDTVLSMRERHANSLAAAFEAGEESVYECLVIYLVTAKGYEVIQLPYTRTDKGTLWHEDVEFPDGAEFGGRLIEVLQAVWA